MAALILSLLLRAPAALPAPTIHAYLFNAPGCPGCDEAEDLIARIVEDDPQIALRTLNVYEDEDYELAEALLTVAGIREDKLPVGPALLVGETYVDQSRFNERNVRAAVERYRVTGAPSWDERAERIRGYARQSLPQHLRRWGVLAIIGAGLLDGINPCAFATVVFFLSYLGMVGARGRPLAFVGLCFALGVFAAYFAFGLGILNATLALSGFPLVRRVLYGVIAVACAVFAVLSRRDARALAAGRTGAVRLQLSTGLKRRAHGLIRSGVRARLLAPTSLLAGAGVAVLELACTGQVYVPALIYMLSLTEVRAQALRWLLLYDALFVLPLLILTGLAAWGTSSTRLAEIARGQAGRTRLLLALLLALAALYFGMRAAGL
ncbi:MAG: hypothetical protein AB7Y46_00040 [Armatimonadota bacterium]